MFGIQRRWCASAVALASTSCLAQPGFLGPVTIEDLGIEGGGEASINASGQVAGYWWDGDAARCFRRTDGVGLELLPQIPNHRYTEKIAINSHGDVLMSVTLHPDPPLRAAYLYTDADGLTLITAFITTDREVRGLNDAGQMISNPYQNTWRNHATRYTPGVGVTDMWTLRGESGESVPLAINNAGQVVGWTTTMGRFWHAFRYTDGTGLQDLGTLGSQSLATAINNRGDVVGWCSPYFDPEQPPQEPQENRHIGFIYTNERDMEPLGFIRGTQGTIPAAINDRRWVVGSTDYNNTFGHPFPAFLWTRETGILNLNTFLPPGSGWYLRFATDINNAGQIVGSGYHNGKPRMFRMTIADFRCPADFDRNDVVDTQDFFAFVNAYFAEDTRADFNGDAIVNSQDFLDFLAALFGGC